MDVPKPQDKGKAGLSLCSTHIQWLREFHSGFEPSCSSLQGQPGSGAVTAAHVSGACSGTRTTLNSPGMQQNIASYAGPV